MPAPDDYDDGEIDGIMIGRGNQSTLCPPNTLYACSDVNPDRRSGKPAINSLSYSKTLLNTCYDN
jgi:hypothetical protein